MVVGALCRVVSLVPEFLLTNCLQQPVYLRQDRTQGPLVEVKPGETHPVYWPQQELPQHLQFVVGRCSPSGWSGPVVASEETAGRTWVAVPSSSPKPTQPDVYAVDVAPEGGAKSIAIRASDTGGAFVVRNCCPTVQRVMVHTFHSEMNSSSSSRQTGRPPEADCHFFAHEGQSVVYGWPFPFLYKSRPVSNNISTGSNSNSASSRHHQPTKDRSSTSGHPNSSNTGTSSNATCNNASSTNTKRMNRTDRSNN
ncbi:Chromosome III, complete sequence, related [Eimeria maxima]|uniref:Chromosome III, complete sequence, related n=1 Tax=Eimeria maxima TaxID=5804 RepID=U6LWP7_EIMMA|nr:Chromosome III, complete sequence, related [Eimeria maxima]CDJ56151.1 Chromosome III, complete sequence, related [Eimeria maxima]